MQQFTREKPAATLASDSKTATEMLVTSLGNQTMISPVDIYTSYRTPWHKKKVATEKPILPVYVANCIKQSISFSPAEIMIMLLRIEVTRHAGGSL